ncbi:MAG: MSHA biogenesis protein MshJ [Hydrogenophilales bacterium]|nr:MSHA biogenesis protein MshJ [Hydrogenophilales bacterium]
MKARLKQWAERIDAMSLRERLMIFTMLAVALTALAMTSAIDPLSAKQKQLTQKRAQTQAQTQALEAQMQALAEASKNDPDLPNKIRLTDLDAKRKSAYAELSNVKQGLVTPDQMTQVLRDWLGRNPRLTLVSIKTLAVRPLTEAVKPAGQTAKPEAKPKEKSAAGDLGLYKHGVEISVEGSYADLVAYLAELEQLPWRVYWGGVNLSAQSYPVSRLTLTVYTLSLDKTWLSV